jgi:two-component system phosphate regulon response regulator OmpR
MLTARGDPLDRIIGLEMGADDYLPKPFTPRELFARIQALIRRQRVLGAHGGPPVSDACIVFGEHTLRLGERRLEHKGAEVPLGSAEFALLRAFALHPNRPLGRDRLIELAHGRDHDATDRSIDVQVMRLRRLIEADPAQPRHIRTVWGVGYVFVPDARPA